MSRAAVPRRLLAAFGGVPTARFGQRALHALSVVLSLAGSIALIFSIWRLTSGHRLSIEILLSAHDSEAPLAPWILLVHTSASLVFMAVVCLMAWFHTRQPSTAWFSLMIASFVAMSALFALKVLHESFTTHPLFVWGWRTVDAIQSVLVVRAAQTWPRAVVHADFATANVWWMRAPRLRASLSNLLTGWHLWVIVVPAAITAAVLGGSPPGMLFYGLLFLPPLAILHVSFVSGERNEKRRVFWFFETVLLLLMLFIVRNILISLLALLGHAWLETMATLLWRVAESAVMIACLVIGVFFVGAVSPTVIVRRTIVFGTVISALLFVILIGEEYGIQEIQQLTGIRSGLASAVLCAVCGVAFEPFRARVNKVLKHWLPAEPHWSSKQPA